MIDLKTPAVVHNPWRRLRQYTDARIGLGRAGVSLPTSELLAFQLAHARARDSVHFPLDIPELELALSQTTGVSELGKPLHLHSLAPDRITYLQRPDLGRQLSEPSITTLERLQLTLPGTPDIALVIADGLSSRAVQYNAAEFLAHFIDQLNTHYPQQGLTPPLLVEQGRVAIGDEIGNRIQARLVVVLIGERPGLSSPDSLGIYLTYAPHPGLPDARRNCISNVRPAGLCFAEAAQRLIYLIREAERIRTSGVALKDRSGEVVLDDDQGGNFLV